MSPSKPPQPPHLPLIEGDAEKPAPLQRAQHMAEKLLSRHLKPRVEKAVERAGPLIEKGARAALLKLADPARARMLQKTMASLAQWTMNTGFELDPHARLFFDFVDTLEQAHSREVLMGLIGRHAIGYEPDLMALMLKAAKGSTAHADAEASKDFYRQRERLSDAMLDLLCELAALESQNQAPHTRAAQLAFFKDAPIDARFKKLARMAVGEPAAFAEADQDDPPPDAPPGQGDTPSANAPEGMLSRLIPSLSDPATRFLTTSHLFFLQSYLMRSTIEGLPEMLATVAELEREEELRSEDIMTMDPTDASKK